MEMRMQQSASQRRILEQTGIKTVEELMYADLRKIGWDKSDAFYAAFRNLYYSYPRSEQNALMRQLENDPKIKARIEGKKQEEERIPLDDLAKETSKEKILSDLLIARRRTKEGTKEWNDLTKMIADYAKIKQDDIKTDEQPIRYFLPVNYPRSCKDCLIFQNKERKGKENLAGKK